MYTRDITRVMGPFYHPNADLGVLSGMPNEGETGTQDDDKETLEDKGDEDKENEDNKGEEDKDKDKDDDVGDEDKENEEEDKEDEDKEDKDKDKEDEDEDEEVDETVRATWTDIKKKYPEFGKDFPDVKAALFRDQQFTEIFATPAEARESLEKNQTFDQIADDVVGKGDILNLLEHTKTTNKDSYEKIVLSVLPYLQEKDKDLYYELAARPIKQLLRYAWQEGNGDKTDLGKAAAHIHKFFFKNLNFDEKVKSEGNDAPSKSKREQELEEKLTSIEQGKQKEFMSSIDDSYINKMSKNIREGLDEDDRLTEWSKAKIVEDILKEVRNQLRKDGRYQSTLKSLLKQATSAGFTNDFKTRIINAALVRAKSLVPDVRKRVVSEAMKTAKKKSEDKERETTRRESRDRDRERDTPRRHPSNSDNKKPLTDLDILRG